MKSQKLFKLAALVLSLVFCFGLFAACAPNTDDPDTSADPSNTDAIEEHPEDTLVVGYGNFSQKFSPFFAETAYDQDAVGLTQLGMMTTDRNGDIIMKAIEGETTVYNGTEYFYQGPCDLTMERMNQGEENETTVYTIHMRDDIVFSDGTPATANDIIFSMYVILDPGYTGGNTLNSVGVQGYEAFRYNSDAVDKVDAMDYINNMADHENMQQWVIENITTPILTEEMEWIEGMYADPETAGGWVSYVSPEGENYVENPVEFYNWMYGANAGEFKETTETAEEAVAAAIEFYGYDHAKLALAYGYGVLDAPNAFVDQEMEDAAYTFALEDYVANGGESNEVPNVSGIVKVDDYTVQVTCDGFMANAIYQVCAGTISPMHYYGSAELWDYDNNMFGFVTRADNDDPNGISMVSAQEKTINPMGAGPYVFQKYDNRTVFFVANEKYYSGAPKIKYLNLKETAANEFIGGVATGVIDIGDPTASVDILKEIAQYNTDTNDITGNTITSSLVWNLGYGYVGINAARVNVGGDPASEASKALRKGYATVIAAYRGVSYDSYYGDSAEVIEYPISTTSWAAPKAADDGYKIAFSEDADGNPIYTDDMTGEAIFDAALEGAKTWFMKAGYTWDDAQGKFTEAPEGAKMEYEVLVPGDGQGAHPTYQLLIKAKEKLESIGIGLYVNDCGQNYLWNTLDGGDQDMWCAAWGSTIDPDMYQVYHSDNRLQQYGGKSFTTNSNKYSLGDNDLDELIMDARRSDDRAYRTSAYKQCLDIIMDWAVEIPCYQRKNLIIFSSERINLDTLTKDITTYWTWMSELEKLELAD